MEDYQTIADSWLAIQPKVVTSDTFATLEHKLELTDVLGLALLSNEVPKKIDLSKMFTDLGVSVIQDILGLYIGHERENLQTRINLINNANDNLGQRVAFVLLRYRNVFQSNQTYYVAKIPVIAECYSMVIMSHNATPQAPAQCTQPHCGCTVIRNLVKPMLFCFKIWYPIKRMMSDLSQFCEPNFPKNVTQFANSNLAEFGLSKYGSNYEEVASIILRHRFQNEDSRFAREKEKWDFAEDCQLLDEWRDRIPINTMSEMHLRSKNAIQSRLEYLSPK